MGEAAVSLLDYGVGNLGSVRNMFRRLGIASEDITAPEQLAGASRVLLPGVGAYDHGMRTLTEGGWDSAIRDFVQTGKPLLGICLGMQLLLDSSEEGELDGFGFVPGKVVRFTAGNGLRVPHMGWNYASPTQASPLFDGLDSTHNDEAEARFYFVHSYYATPNHEQNVLTTTQYGHKFASSVVHENVHGTQFHPEKSHRYGMQLLENFSRL